VRHSVPLNNVQSLFDSPSNYYNKSFSVLKQLHEATPILGSFSVRFIVLGENIVGKTIQIGDLPTILVIMMRNYTITWRGCPMY